MALGGASPLLAVPPICSLRLLLAVCVKAPLTVSMLPGLSVTLALLPTVVKLAEPMTSSPTFSYPTQQGAVPGGHLVLVVHGGRDGQLWAGAAVQGVAGGGVVEDAGGCRADVPGAAAAVPQARCAEPPALVEWAEGKQSGIAPELARRRLDPERRAGKS
jgi:hypothetical protein